MRVGGSSPFRNIELFSGVVILIYSSEWNLSVLYIFPKLGFVFISSDIYMINQL